MNTYIDTALFVKAFVLEEDSAETITLLEQIGEPLTNKPFGLHIFYDPWPAPRI